jgi:hypothetical protein
VVVITYSISTLFLNPNPSRSVSHNKSHSTTSSSFQSFESMAVKRQQELDDSYSGQVKKQKSSGVSTMGQIANGLNSIVTAFGKETVAIQESVSMFLVGQASQLV